MKFWSLDTDGPGDDAELEISGEIVAERGWFSEDGECVARDFREALSKCGNVTVKINSPGGDVMAGSEIFAALREHSDKGRGQVRVVITALAASAASVIAMAGDTVEMYPTSYMMIHNPWTIAMGDARELRKTAKTLDVISEGLIAAYQTRTGKTEDELKRMLEAETWMSAATCVEEGFADRMIGIEDAPVAALVTAKMSAKAHGVQEIAARIREDGDGRTMWREAGEKLAEAQRKAEEEKRQNIARRAGILARLPL